MFRIEGGHKIDGSKKDAYKRIQRHYSQWLKTFKGSFYHIYAAPNIMCVQRKQFFTGTVPLAQTTFKNNEAKVFETIFNI